ncbi:MAG: hypothetical protein ABIZ04_06015 [Opitutus sp.]
MATVAGWAALAHTAWPTRRITVSKTSGTNADRLEAETAEIFYRHIEIKEPTEDIPMESLLKCSAAAQYLRP